MAGRHPVTGHAEVHAELAATGEVENLHLAPSHDRQYPIAREGTSVTGRESASLGAVVHGYARYDAANRDTSSDRCRVFDFGKLGHSATRWLSGVLAGTSRLVLLHPRELMKGNPL
jgi:hypothetical protein